MLGEKRLMYSAYEMCLFKYILLNMLKRKQNYTTIYSLLLTNYAKTQVLLVKKKKLTNNTNFL